MTLNQQKGTSVLHQQTVPRDLVHKSSLDEVFITDFRPTSPTGTMLGAQLPRAHTLYCEYPVQCRQPDLAALIEICRQACFVVAHQQFDVPLVGNQYQFLFQELDAELTGTEPLDTSQPVNLTVLSEVERIWRRGATVSGLLWAFTLLAGEQPVATVRIRMTWIDRPKWRQMRAAMHRGRELPGAPVPPALVPGSVGPAEVGRVNPENVVLQQITHADAGSSDAVARIDIRHPVLFDHSIDHVYAMVQLEACRQLSLAAAAHRWSVPAAGLEMSACSAAFTSVAEFELATELHGRCIDTGAGAGGRPATTMRIEVTQGSRVASTFTVTVRPVLA